MMLKCILIFYLISLCYFSNGLPAYLGKNESLIIVKVTESNLDNLIGTPWQKCSICLCYAERHCHNITTCFSPTGSCGNSISQNYWTEADSPAIFDNMGEQAAYNACMRNENCVINTIRRFTSSFGKIDCDGDEIYDCRDKFYIHRYGEDCKNKKSDDENTLLSECFDQIGIETLPEDKVPDPSR